MVYDIATELSQTADLTRTIPEATISLMAFAGAALMCACAVLVILVKRNFGLRFMPVLYGASIYLLFCYFIGSVLSNVVNAVFLSGEVTNGMLIVSKSVSLLMSVASLVAGRFFAQWFIKRFYSDYCDYYGIGIGISIIESVMAGIIILLNYVLCLTINTNGLAEYLNSFETLEEAKQQLLALESVIETPAYYYLLLGLGSIMKAVFHVGISTMFFAITSKKLSKVHIVSVMALTYLLYLPESLFSTDAVTSMLISSLLQVAVFGVSIFIFVRVHRKYFSDIKPVYSKRMQKKYSQTTSKMPDFNKNIKN